MIGAEKGDHSWPWSTGSQTGQTHGVWLCLQQRELSAVGRGARPHKVPCGDAAISKMQIAHFLDFCICGFG